MGPWDWDSNVLQVVWSRGRVVVWSCRKDGLTVKHTAEETVFQGYNACRLACDEAQIAAEFVPSAGMVGVSLTHRGEELLVLGKTVRQYVEGGGTLGIPFLHPWGNRLGGDTYGFDETAVNLAPVSAIVSRDPHGLPIHGLAPGRKVWSVREFLGGPTCARLVAVLNVDEASVIFPGFPFPHRIEQIVTLSGTSSGAGLSIETTVTATGTKRVPVVFGWHPYFHLPGVKRSEWVVDAPVGRRYTLSEQSLPTGERTSAALAKGPLGERVYDDLFDELGGTGNGEATFTVAGGGRMIGVRFEIGYDYAIVWAPQGRDLICFEPMTAPTNALATGWPGLAALAPGESYRARFSILVTSL